MEQLYTVFKAHYQINEYGDKAKQLKGFQHTNKATRPITHNS